MDRQRVLVRAESGWGAELIRRHARFREEDHEQALVLRIPVPDPEHPADDAYQDRSDNGDEDPKPGLRTEEPDQNHEGESSRRGAPSRNLDRLPRILFCNLLLHEVATLR